MYLHISHTVWSLVCCYHTLLPNVLMEKKRRCYDYRNQSLSQNIPQHHNVLWSSACNINLHGRRLYLCLQSTMARILFNCSSPVLWKQTHILCYEFTKKQLLGKRIFTTEASMSKPHTNESNYDFSYIYIYIYMAYVILYMYVFLRL